MLTKSSWDPGWLTSTRRVTARDQLPRADTQHTSDSTPVAHPGNQAAGTGEVIRHTTHLGRVCSPSTWSPKLLRPEKGKKHRSLCLCSICKSLNLSDLDLGSTCNPGPALSVPLQSNLETEQCRPEKHTHREWGQTQCGPDTASTPHTRW